MGTLYVVSTPIGNLEDITLRALRLLREVSLIAAEDTRHTRKLLNHFNIVTPTTSYHQHSAPSRIEALLHELETGDLALVTDAGTPGISDPGGPLIAAAVAAGYPVVPVPGASALLTLAAASGQDATRFAYVGFMPRKGKERADMIERAARTGWPFILYESPQRLTGTLNDLLGTLGNRPVTVGRELTKLHEEIYRGRLQDALVHFAARPVRGEVALMVGAPIKGEATPEAQAPEVDLDTLLRDFRTQGLPAKEAARQAAKLAGVSTREAYNRLIKLDEQNEPG